MNMQLRALDLERRARIEASIRMSHTDADAGLITPAIMCGGLGTGLWPASRESMPKQFIPLLGELSSFQTTARRFAGDGFGRLIVISTSDVRFIVAEQLQAIGLDADIVLEPERRGSAAAVAVVTELVARRDPGAIVLVLAADHLVPNADAFVNACQMAAAAAHAGRIMTLGVKPTAPTTRYGYIQPGVALDGKGSGSTVASFVEKPDRDTAWRYVDEGYLWNSGNLLFRADVMTAELRAHAPEVLTAARAAVDRAETDLDFIRLPTAEFAAAPRVSIEHAVMERTIRAGVVPVSFAWSDVGTWDAIWNASDRDAEGNVLRGKVQTLDTRDSLVHSDSMLTAVLGLDNVTVVATRDAVLVASRERLHDVKQLVAELKAQRRSEVADHLLIYRPWGCYQRIDAGARFHVKRITVKPGQRLSLQKHFHRAEHWVVVRGTAEVTIDGEVILRHENEAAYLPIGCVHRLANPGKIDLELIEVQVGSYTGEDDIVRFEDVYGR